jgi:hypothetical protein
VFTDIEAETSAPSVRPSSLLCLYEFCMAAYRNAVKFISIQDRLMTVRVVRRLARDIRADGMVPFQTIRILREKSGMK